MITRLEIENFKAIKKLAIDLNPLTVLVGPNDSGKSTILQALDVLGRTVTRPIWKVGEPSVFDTDPAELLGDQRSATMRFAVNAMVRVSDEHEIESRYEIILGLDRGTWTVRREMLSSDSSVNYEHTPGPAVELPDGSVGPWDGSRTILDRYAQAHAAPFREVRAALRSFFVSLEPKKIMVPCGPDAAVDSTGLGLPALIDRLLTDTDRTARDAYETSLRRFSPHVTAIGTRPVHINGVAGAQTIDKELVFGLPNRRTVAAREASSGLLLTAGYVALRHTDYARFLVEEPENGVHPRLILLIADLLRGLARDQRQVILTTHSPILLNYMDPEDVMVVTRDAEGVHVKPIVDTPHFDERTRDFDLGELWYAVGEDALVSNAP